jgi:hypothetical protein
MNRKVLQTFCLLMALWALMFQVPVYAGTTDFDKISSALLTLPQINADQTEQAVQITGVPQIVVVSGTNYEMGYQYGQQAAALIYQNKVLMRKGLESLLGAATIANDIKVWTYYLEKYDLKLKDWLNGIVAGCKNKKYTVTYADLVLNMVYPQELWARPQDPYPKVTHVTALSRKTKSTQKAHMCSAFGATKTATSDGKPILTQSAITEVEQAGFVILIAYPTDGYSYITFPHAGRAGGNHGLNSKGFAWSMNAAPAMHSLWGVTSEVYFHYLNQYCASSAQAQKYLESTTRGGVTGLFLFADGDSTNKLYAFEANGQASAARNPGDLGEKDFVIFANDFRGPDMTVHNYPGDFQNNEGRYWTNWMHIMPVATTSAIDVDFVKSAWKSPDWYDKSTETWHYDDPLNANVPGNPFGVGGQTQNIILPASLTIYMQFGSPSGVGWPAYATGEYTKLQLLSDIPKVLDAAQADALTMYTVALEKYLKMVNAGTIDVNYRETMREKLNEAYDAWAQATVTEAEAYYATKKADQMALYGEAITGYSKAQLYSQMVTTGLNSLK